MNAYLNAGPRCRECGVPLVEAGSGWSCAEPECPRCGKLVLRLREPDEGAIPSYEVVE